MRSRIWLALSGALALLGSAAGARPPNIVLILGDDHGWPHAGFMGHPVVRTPNLDRLATAGTVFTQVQLPASVCRPTLQTFLSGLHPTQWRAKREALTKRQEIADRQEVVHYRTLPRELARRGYRSWEGGKMWEGTYAQAGFTEGMADVAETGFFRIAGSDFGRQGWDPARCGPLRATDAPCPVLDPLRSFLDGSRDAPFFAWFAPKLPHTPFDPPIEFVLPYLAPGLAHPARLYYAQVTRLDAVIGELLRELEERDLLEDTLLVYVSDNGWAVGQSPLGELLDGKGTLHELGTRTPLVFHWPGRVPEGVVRDELVSAEDLVPTLLDYAGGEPLPDRRGASLRRAIEGGIDPDEAPGDAPDVRTPGSVALDHYASFHAGTATRYTGYFVRTARWRYMFFWDLHEELYEVAIDPFERSDLSGSRPELLPDLRDTFRRWIGEIALAAPRLEIAGRLVAPDGAPIAGASLRLVPADAVESAEALEVTTDRNGAFRFQHLPHGDYVIGAGARVEQVEPIAVSLPVGPVGSYLPEVLGVARAEPPRAGEAHIRGRVFDAAGSPLADTTVVVERPDGPGAGRVVVRTDPDGRYLAENLPRGRYRVRVGGGDDASGRTRCTARTADPPAATRSRRRLPSRQAEPFRSCDVEIRPAAEARPRWDTGSHAAGA